MSFPRTLPLPCSLLLRSIPGPSLSSNLYVSLKFKFKQLHWHDKRGSRLSSFSKSAPSHSYAPCPSNLWSGLEYGVRTVWCWGGAAEACVLGQICGQPHYEHVSIPFVWGTALTGFLFGITQTTTVLWSRSASACACDMCVSESSYLTPKRFPFMSVYYVQVIGKFIYHSFSTIHTCARHLERIWVRAIVSISANAVNSTFTGGTAVDGTLHTGLISLSRLEKAWQTG